MIGGGLTVLNPEIMTILCATCRFQIDIFDLLSKFRGSDPEAKLNALKELYKVRICSAAPT